MLLAIDIGNTNITIGAFKENELIFVSRILTEYKATDDQCAVNIMDICLMNDVSVTDFREAIISSVVPMLTQPMITAIERLIGCVPMIVNYRIKTGVNFSLVDESALGTDLIIGSVAAISKYNLPCIVIDLGTATTVTIIDKNKKFLGGCIIPGVKISLEALTAKASLLPDINLEPSKSLICTDTKESICSGTIYGTASMIDGLIDRIEQELGYECTIIATGGLSSEIIPYCKKNINLCENLLLYGLLKIYQLNIKI